MRRLMLILTLTACTSVEPAPEPTPRPQVTCLADPGCAAHAFLALANAERDAGNGEAQRQALVIAKALEAGDCAGANQIWFIGYQRQGEQAMLIAAQRVASRAIEAACPLR